MDKRNPETISNCLKLFQKSWSDFDNLIRVSNSWNDLVGKELAKECKPLKIEKNILTIIANHPQWRHALIYNKHNLKDSINKLGLNLKNIRIIQHYEEDSLITRFSDSKIVWDKHPSRIKKNELTTCKKCNSPTPIGEIKRWDCCTFCWRKTL